MTSSFFFCWLSRINWLGAVQSSPVSKSLVPLLIGSRARLGGYDTSVPPLYRHPPTRLCFVQEMGGVCVQQKKRARTLARIPPLHLGHVQRYHIGGLLPRHGSGNLTTTTSSRHLSPHLANLSHLITHSLPSRCSVHNPVIVSSGLFFFFFICLSSS
ncbi:hypothetical protein BXZ70DRAFT_175179 [Cristinia sonorae]|uniref:Secreted protein n=1 Tax=Cristinia sonorae TaxID=1940300 RepID=A0A8K0UMB5_9AGAR|nr:hypothetical protein BXZ70DRAFT_175179 [Cristinia sonorae]